MTVCLDPASLPSQQASKSLWVFFFCVCWPMFFFVCVWIFKYICNFKSILNCTWSLTLSSCVSENKYLYHALWFIKAICAVVLVWTKWNAKDCFNKPAKFCKCLCWVLRGWGSCFNRDTWSSVWVHWRLCVTFLYIPSLQRASHPLALPSF